MDASNDGTLYGDPTHQADYYVTQTQSEDCVEMSADDLIAQVTGVDVSEADITAHAEQMQSTVATDPLTGQPMQLYTPGAGTDFHDTPALLADYGVASTFTDDSTVQSGGEPTGMDALETQLASGHQVIASVDAETIWNSLGIASQPDSGSADHAVVVTGVDADNGLVYLNDTGVPNGAAEAVPISVFEQAWATSQHAMVTTDGGALAPTTDPTNVPGPGLAPSAEPLPTDVTVTPVADAYHEPFAFGADPLRTDAFDSDDSWLIATGGAALAAGAVATLLHPRARAIAKDTFGRARSRGERPA